MSNILNVIGKIPANLSDEKLARLYFEYDSDMDPNGSRGIGIAEAVFAKCHNNPYEVHTWIRLHQFYYEHPN